MKKFISILISYLFIITNTFALAPNNFHNVQWEVRPWATANNVNGCGFATSDNRGNEFGGTDYTQQDNAQLTLTDLATSSGTDCTVTSVAGGFTAGMVGNMLHLNSCTSGCTPEWYLVTKVIDGNTITVSSSPSGGQPMVGGNGKIGGACSMNSNLDDDMFENVASSNTVWISSGVTRWGETVTIGSAKCTVSTPCYISGYSQVRGDTFNVFDTSTQSVPTIDSGVSGAITTGQAMAMQNIYLSGNGSGVITLGTSGLVKNIKAINTSSTVGRFACSSGVGSTISNSEFISQNGYGLNLTGSNTTTTNVYAHDSRDGIQLNQSQNRLISSVVNSNFNSGLNTTSSNLPVWVENVTVNGFQNIKVGTACVIFATSTIMIRNSILSNHFTTFAPIIAGRYPGKIIGSWNANNALYNIYSTGTNFDFDSSTLYLTTSPYTDVSEIYGATAAISGTQLFMHGGGFFADAGITDGKDFLTCHWGSGATAMSYLILNHGTHSVTLNGTIGTNTTQDKVFTISKGKNFAVSNVLKGKGMWTTVPGSSTTVSVDIGGVQRVEQGTGSGSAGFFIQ